VRSGYEKDDVGKQFVGRSGKVLRTVTRGVGFDFDRDFYVQNTFRCFPNGGGNALDGINYANIGSNDTAQQKSGCYIRNHCRSL